MKRIFILLVTVLLVCIPLLSIYAASTNVAFNDVITESIVLFLEKSNVLVYGRKQYISDNREIVPFKKGNDIMIPVEFFAETLSGTCTYQDNKATIAINGNTLAFDVQKGFGNVFYANIIDLCNAFDLHFYQDNSGLLAYSVTNLSAALDWNRKFYEMRDMVESFIFDDLSGLQLYANYLSQNPSNEHPCLIISNDKMEAIRAEIAKKDGDEVYKKLSEEIIYVAENYLHYPVLIRKIDDGIRLSPICQEAQKRIFSCAIAYHLTLEEKYAERAYAEMEAVCSFTDWNPERHFLDVGIMSAGVALGYDWLYNWMTPEQRETIRNGLYKHSIYAALEDINDDFRSSYRWFREDAVSNWRIVCGGGVGLASLAIMGDLADNELQVSQYILQEMMRLMQPSLLQWAPSGAHDEGAGYWSLASHYLALFMKALETSTGSNYGYLNVPGLKNANSYVTAVNGPVEMFNYHNVSEVCNIFTAPTILFYADEFNDYSHAQTVIKTILNNKFGNDVDNIVPALLYYDPQMSQLESNQTAPLDAYMQVSEIATLRNGWERGSQYIGLHCDQPFGAGRSGVEHMDAGHFQLQSDGIVWFKDIGCDSYNLSHYETAYRFRAEGHNTVIFDPERDYAMKKHGNVYISAFQSCSVVSYAVGNMTDAYPDSKGVESFLRGIKLEKETGITYVQDEIRVTKPVEMYWFAHTRANIIVSDDGKSATLLQNGKTLRAYILNGEGASFSVMDAVPLPTSPQIQGESTKGIRKLTIHIEQCDGIDLCIAFVPGDELNGSNAEACEYTPIESWKDEIIEETPPIQSEPSTTDLDTTDTPTSPMDTFGNTIVILCCAVVTVCAIIISGVCLKKH